MKTKKGSAVVEMVAVVVILGVLAAIVIPQFTETSEDTKTSSLHTDIQWMRSMIELYKIQHGGNLPGFGAASFIQALTGETDHTGAVGDHYGPYIDKMPVNAFTGLNTVRFESGAQYEVPVAKATHGWVFNITTGEFRADSVGHAGY